MNGTPLGIAIRAAGENACVIELLGELDLGTIPRLEGKLMGALQANDGVVLDLGRLSFIDSSGIGLLIQAHRATGGDRQLHLVVSRDSQVERVFNIAGIDRALPVFLDRDAAIAALAAQAGRRKARGARAA
jgi:anti-anti-sigma factor